MNWEQLFSTKRTGRENRASHQDKGVARTEYQRDFDRVVYSSAFRRLQNKTQVVPLPENDFIRNRLTHSLETSSVGRSLGDIVGHRIVAENEVLFKKINVGAYDFGAVVAAACLAHDIGNPPFGHSGEDAISEFFSSKKAEPFVASLTDKQKADLQNFEGNAAGFRLISYTLPGQSAIKGGLGLTYTTLAAFTKYPKESLPKRKGNGLASEKKFGFFQGEKGIFKQVADEVGLINKSEGDDWLWSRHPLAFLMEAADDICYTINDFEDGYKLNCVPFEQVEAMLQTIVGSNMNKERYDQIYDKREKISYLRATAINQLVSESADAFIEKEKELLSGTFDKPLTEIIPSAQALEDIRLLSVEKIYKNRPNLEIEAAGFVVMAGLLEMFLNAVMSKGGKQNKKILNLIPDQYLDVERKPFKDAYTNTLNIAGFVSSMTDVYAISLYRKLNGISLPNF